MKEQKENFWSMVHKTGSYNFCSNRYKMILLLSLA